MSRRRMRRVRCNTGDENAATVSRRMSNDVDQLRVCFAFSEYDFIEAAVSLPKQICFCVSKISVTFLIVVRSVHDCAI